ncbi:hypothetical protein ABE10_13195 [Bacillus toyonensis]|nr:hypothetical protein [Bacillus toyonensis]
MNRRGLGASGVGIGAVLALVVAQPSFASEPAPPVDSGAAVMRTSDAVASGIGLAPAQSEAVDGNAVTVKAGEESFEVTLPVAKTPVEEITSSGLVALADESSFAIVPVSMADGSVAIHSVINDASAPREFAYDLGLPVGATVSVDPKTGSVIALDSDGNFLLGAAAPWARDANGVELPTWYTVQGTSL